MNLQSAAAAHGWLWAPDSWEGSLTDQLFPVSLSHGLGHCPASLEDWWQAPSPSDVTHRLWSILCGAIIKVKTYWQFSQATYCKTLWHQNGIFPNDKSPSDHAHFGDLRRACNWLNSCLLHSRMFSLPPSCLFTFLTWFVSLRCGQDMYISDCNLPSMTPALRAPCSFANFFFVS